MKILTVLFCLCVPLMGADKKPLTKEESVKVIEAAIREQIRKPTGELTKADLEKVTTQLNLSNNQLTDVKGLERLMQLRLLSMRDNSDLTEDQKSKLQKALPHCSILFHL